MTPPALPRRPQFRKPACRPKLFRPAVEALETRTLLTGTWTKIASPLPNGDAAQDSLLLSDGSIMVHGGGYAASKAWYKLTPDSSGSYVNGSWTTLAPMNLERLDFTTLLLPDGRVFVMGGEYTGPDTMPTETNTGEIYDPVQNKWTSIADFPQSEFGDDPIQLLPGGKVLAGYISGPQTYIYDPAHDTWTPTGDKLRSESSSEDGWVKLPDDSILSYDIFSAPGTNAQRYVPATGAWEDAGTLAAPLSGPGFLNELGPGFLLSDGRVIFFGANNNTAYYAPSTNSWTAGPAMPGGFGAGDEPGAVLPNGKVFIAVTDTNYFKALKGVYELDTSTNTYTDIKPADNSADLSEAGFGYDAVVLPTGQVLLVNRNAQMDVYTPDGAPQDSWRPTVSSLTPNGATYTLTGTQLNGISGGAYYGDEDHAGTNYPVVRLSDAAGTVEYARTSNWSSTGVATGSTAVTTDVALPADIQPGAVLQVSATAPSGATEGKSLDNVVVAQFTDPSGTHPRAGYSATVNWGDGTTSAGTISDRGGGTYAVSGTHTYTTESGSEHPGSNPFTMTVTVTENFALAVVANGIASQPFTVSSTGTDHASLTVDDPSVIAAGVGRISAKEGVALNSVVVATFTDPGGIESTSDYAATVNWGDSEEGFTGTIVHTTSNQYAVHASHTYATQSTMPFTITVTISHELTAPAHVTSTALVANAAPTAQVRGSATRVRNLAATFIVSATDTTAADTAAGFTYSVKWGDGTARTNTGPSSGNGSGVSLSHTFTFAGTFTVSVTAIDRDGAVSTVASRTITIVPADVVGRNLIVGGSGKNDRIRVDATHAPTVDVSFSSTKVGHFTLPSGGKVIVLGTASNDIIELLGSVPGQLHGGGGNDRITGGSGKDLIWGDDGNDELHGGAGDDTLYGGAGNDILFGDAGTDALHGGAGNDVLVGGTGKDRLIPETGANISIGGLLIETSYSAARLMAVCNTWAASSGGASGAAKADTRLASNKPKLVSDTEADTFSLKTAGTDENWAIGTSADIFGNVTSSKKNFKEVV